MATAIAARPPSPAAPPTPPRPLNSHHHQLQQQQQQQTHVYPHKHIPYCPPGPRPAPSRLDASNASAVPTVSAVAAAPSVLTHPPDAYQRLNVEPPVFAVSAAQLQDAVDHMACQPLPASSNVFPWLHGLHADNHMQLTYFVAGKKSLRRPPRCLRGLAIVKARGDLSHSRLCGAIAPDELLKPCAPPSNQRTRASRTRSARSIDADADADAGREGESDDCCFLDIDPRSGFGVRNFQIQACKMATVSDIVVYGDLVTPRSEVEALAVRLSRAQAAWLRKSDPRAAAAGERPYNTFVLSEEYDVVEADHPDLVALDSEGCMTGKVLDFFHRERVEMYSMSSQSEISHNVWLGPTPDPSLGLPGCASFDVMIEASDMAQLPDDKAFELLDNLLDRRDSLGIDPAAIPQLEFPASGAIPPPTWSYADVDGLLATCEWIHSQAHASPRPNRRRRDSKLSPSPPVTPDHDKRRSSPSHSTQGRRILIHCGDGYTESSLLALAYYMYSECAPAHDAWLALHRERGRNFFAYASDLALLRAVQPRLLEASPRYDGSEAQLCPAIPAWLDRMDGSFPSRILDYMYLGNLGHANNPELLRELGIGQILSVGEPLSWTAQERASWPAEKLMHIDRVQDNGVDPLMDEFGRCLQFIETGRKNGTATLVHCRVGVSRSATICIAEVMNELGMSFPRAYCFVRARRLNVIIQPHLRFCYELLQWEEAQCRKRGRPLRRELEWACIAREIASMNRPYAKQK